MNISSSPGYTSVDPLLLADTAGTIHLFWAERVDGEPDATPDVPDTLMYAAWNGQTWSKPIDIFLSPREIFEKRISGIRGVIDDRGRIHLVWMGPENTFYYSFAHAAEAGNAQAWQRPALLATDQSGSQYSIDIKYEAPGKLHIIFGRNLDLNSHVLSYIRSDDSGHSWSAPVDIFAFPENRGASNTRLLVGPSGRIYATWTEWDESGNGQAIYFARSLNSGDTWERPVLLAERAEDEYERDWTNLALLDEEHLIAFWEGGWRAYPQAQYSFDGGTTWSDPIDTLYWLIADNGYAEFARDSLGQLHLFVARRIREGYAYKCGGFPECSGEGNAIWHSVWEGGTRWREPQPVGGFQFANFISLAHARGNEVSLAWFVYGEYEIRAMHCQIEGAPPVEPQPWPPPTPEPTVTPVVLSASATQEVAPPLPVRAPKPVPLTPIAQSDPAGTLLSGVIPAVVAIVLLVVVKRSR